MKICQIFKKSLKCVNICDVYYYFAKTQFTVTSISNFPDKKSGLHTTYHSKDITKRFKVKTIRKIKSVNSSPSLCDYCS